MVITDLDYLVLADCESLSCFGEEGIYFTGAYAIAATDEGLSIAEAGAIAFGENTYTSADTYAYAAEDESSTNFLTSTTYEGVAEAEAVAYAGDGEDSYSYQSVTSYSEYSSETYVVVASI